MCYIKAFLFLCATIVAFPITIIKSYSSLIRAIKTTEEISIGDIIFTSLIYPFAIIYHSMRCTMVNIHHILYNEELELPDNID